MWNFVVLSNFYHIDRSMFSSDTLLYIETIGSRSKRVAIFQKSDIRNDELGLGRGSKTHRLFPLLSIAIYLNTSERREALFVAWHSMGSFGEIGSYVWFRLQYPQNVKPPDRNCQKAWPFLSGRSDIQEAVISLQGRLCERSFHNFRLVPPLIFSP